MANVVRLAVETVLGDSVGQIDKLNAKIGSVGTKAEQESRKTSGWSKAWKVGAAAAVGAIGAVSVELDKSIKAAVAMQTAHAQLQKATTNAGVSWKKYGGQIDDVIKKQALLKGFQDTELISSFQKLITVTGSVRQSQKLMGDAMDVSRATGIGLSRATILVAKVQEGSSTALQRYGITLTKVTTAQDALKAKTGTATAAQKAAAKAADLTATAQRSLAVLQQKFGGAAATYGKTAAGSMARYKVAVEQLQVSLGTALLPILTKIVTIGGNLIAKFDALSTSQKSLIVYVGLGVAGFIAAGSAATALTGAFAALKIATIAGTVAQWGMNAALVVANALFDANPVVLVVAGLVALGVALVIAYKKSQTFRDIVNGAFNAVKSTVNSVVGFIQGHWKTMLAIVTGGASSAVIFIINHWDTIKGAFNRVVTFMVNRWGNVKQAISTFAGWVDKYIIGPIKTIIRWAQKAVSWVDRLNPFSGGSGPTATTGGSGGTMSRSHGPGSPGANQQLASSMLKGYGWGQDQMSPLISLWNQESGWSANAVNSSSNAQGIPQLLPSQHPGPHPGFPSWPPVNAGAQIAWGLGYIKGRPDYGSPARAWQHEIAYGWYDQGGVVPGPRGVHRPVMAAGGETILPTHKRGAIGDVTIIINAADLSTPAQIRYVASLLGPELQRRWAAMAGG